MTQAQVAALATLQAPSLSGIERGRRRTRRSTLERLVAALVAEQRRAPILDELVDLAGPALAPESDWAERLDRRRERSERRHLPAAIEATSDALVSARRLVRRFPVGHERHDSAVEHEASLAAALAEMEAKAASLVAERTPRRSRSAGFRFDPEIEALLVKYRPRRRRGR